MRILGAGAGGGDLVLPANLTTDDSEITFNTPVDGNPLPAGAFVVELSLNGGADFSGAPAETEQVRCALTGNGNTADSVEPSVSRRVCFGVTIDCRRTPGAACPAASWFVAVLGRLRVWARVSDDGRGLSSPRACVGAVTASSAPFHRLLLAINWPHV